MADVDLERWIDENFPSPQLERVNAMMSAEEQNAIVAAAHAAHRGNDHDAELFRRDAGYGGLGPERPSY